jgi:transcriptional regulator of acetoin/glycerol metabolism
MEYPWPGNIRELEHLIERSMLMTTGPVIKEVFLPKHVSNGLVPILNQPPIKSLEQNERDHILAVLGRCNWRISGAGQAAEILGLPATTLHSRIKKLGIKKSV